MKLVFDTNVLISAFVTRGHSYEVFEYCLRNHTIFASLEILGEFEEKMAEKLGFKRKSVNEFSQYLKRNLILSDSLAEIDEVCRDPKDNHILALALGSHADAILTGDADLLTLKKFHGIPILTPSAFWTFQKEH